jgi:ankyrin repeat protein
MFGTVICLLAALIARSIYLRNLLNGELLCAVKRLNGLAVKTCLAKGANPNATDPGTRDPLWWQTLAHLTNQPAATYDGDAALLVVLKRCTERDNTEFATRPAGAGALRSVEPTEIVSALLKKGANANVQFASGESAIAYSQGSGYKRCVQMLLGYGARANGISIDGNTLLKYAISADDFDTAYELVKHGANVNASDTSGTTPLAYAMSRGSTNYSDRQRIIQLLLASSAHQ